MSRKIRLLDFNVLNKEIINDETDNLDSDDESTKKDNKEFIIQMFGLDKQGKTYSIMVNDYKPFFYIKVNNKWNKAMKERFLEFVKEKINPKYKNTEYYSDSIISCKLVKKKTLYGFDNGKEYKFIYLKFKNIVVMNKVKNLFYENSEDKDGNKQWTVCENGIKFEGTNMKIYESNIPPLLRFFHIKNISPTGWISINNNYCSYEKSKKTFCDYEITIDSYKYIKKYDSEDKVPYKICSFDIEASSSHGDFPIAKKDYKRLATNIVEYWDQILDRDSIDNIDEYSNILKLLTLSGFGYEYNDYIDIVYIENKDKITKEIIENKINTLLNYKKRQQNNDLWNKNTNFFNKKKQKYIQISVINILNNYLLKQEKKITMITTIFNKIFPEIEGDKVTFIGSTFMKYGDDKPYKNHCIALNTCSKLKNVEIEEYSTEKDVLLAWSKLIEKENPDIIIGYNIFGFDYKFMFERIKSYGNNNVKKFLKMSRNKNEICGVFNSDTDEYDINKSVLKIASGEHNLEFIKMNGRIHIDLYNYFRRDYNLESYKLDYVSGHFICDTVKKIEKNNEEKQTILYSKNVVGLKEGDYIKIEEIGHSSDFYQDGSKFKVINIKDGNITLDSLISPDESKKLKWCLSKDDVSPQDIFRMTNEGPDERSIIAKYCIQDCNLVHYLMNKIDVLTGMIEMGNICSVPIDFIIMRGQGIKLFSFIAKKCREDNTLIPVLKKKNDGGYEGAIVLDPKCGLYLDEPVACVDYSSLYPSSMISENLSHDSKVWTKEYNLEGELIKDTGIKDHDGNYIYDNLPNYKYVDIVYDTFNYVRKTPKGREIKTLCGKKHCRFVQLPDNKLSIMPKILKTLLSARKSTRTSAKYKTITTKNKEKITGLIIDNTDENIIKIKDDKSNIQTIERKTVEKIEDTYNDFMKNVLDKRQLAIKMTANSLYGQCGARTSAFYEKDVAASTTSTGRKLLTYGKRIIEEVYGDRICETKYGKVHSHAEYIYGDTDSVFMSFKLTDPETKKKIVGHEALKHTIELAKEAGELATLFLKEPHDLEYEKTFMPFCLLSKKRYVGMLYEEDPNKCYRKSMGIVLKRRDNAPIVKDVYGGIIDILMKNNNVSEAVKFTKKCLNDIINEKYPLNKLIITKSLRSNYKNPQQIAHKVLADRIAQRDPGNKPKPGDRVPFVYIQTKKKVKLQGDKIENPEYIIQNKLKPDYVHYITNQIMKPVQQVFALVIEDIPEYKKKLNQFKRKINTIRRKNKDDPIKCIAQEQKYRNNEVKELIFNDALRETSNTINSQKSILSFLK
jgi:DNA polymerase elongation subunit (family B)